MCWGQDGRINFDALPANGKGDYCGVLLLRADDELAKPDTDPKDLRKVRGGRITGSISLARFYPQSFDQEGGKSCKFTE